MLEKIKDNWTDLCRNRLLQADVINTFWEISLEQTLMRVSARRLVEGDSLGTRKSRSGLRVGGGRTRLDLRGFHIFAPDAETRFWFWIVEMLRTRPRAVAG